MPIRRHEKYRGVYNSHGKYIEGGIPRIIEDDLFYKVQEMLKINKRAPAKTWTRADYILSDKLFCGKCGAPMFGESGTSKTGARHNYYICSNKKRFKTCDKKAVRQADIEELVIKATCDLLADTELLDLIVENTWQYYLAQDNSQEELRNLTRQLEQTDLAIKNLIRAMEAGSGCSLLVTVGGTRPPRTIDSITELYHFTLSHYGVPALWPTLRHHRWPLASQGLDTGGLLGLTGLDSHQLYVQHRTGAHLLTANSIKMVVLFQKNPLNSLRVQRILLLFMGLLWLECSDLISYISA